MEDTSSRILKADDVTFDGQFSLDVTNAAPNAHRVKTAPSISPSAAIVESDSGFAVIEVICSCGKKTRLRCGYAPE